MHLSMSKKMNQISGIKIFIEKAEDLHHGTGTINPFVTAKIDEKHTKNTEIKKKTTNPEWREFIFHQAPFSKQELTLEVYDAGNWSLFGSTKKLLGLAQIDLSELFDGETKQYKLPLSRAPSGTIHVTIESVNFGKQKVEDLEHQMQALGISPLEPEPEKTPEQPKGLSDSMYGTGITNTPPATIEKKNSQNSQSSGKTFDVIKNYVDSPKLDSIYDTKTETKDSTSDEEDEEEVNLKDKESRYPFKDPDDKIGGGGMGTVFRCKDLLKGHIVALKRVNLDGGLSLTQALKEITPTKGLRHPNIASYLDYFVTKDMKKLCLIMELYTDGDLEHYLNKVKESGKHLKEDELVQMMTQLTAGVGYLHSFNLIHRDLKPGNVFMAEGGKTLKIGDFGLMKDVNQSVGVTFAGTQKYMAPEYFEGEDKTFGKPCDVWSLGVVFYEMAMLDLKNHLYLELFKQQQLAFNKSIMKDIRKNYSSKVAEIIVQMLQKKPSDRPTLQSVLEMLEGKKSTQFLSSGPMNRDLLLNANGEDGLNKWTLSSNKGNGWNVEDGDGPEGKKGKIFVTSSDWCIREQMIDLLSLGFTEDFLDSEPDVVITDWFKGREDVASLFSLECILLDANQKVIDTLKKDMVPTTPTWQSLTHTFKFYGPNLRFIKFSDGGKDSNGMKGHYGAMISSPSVMLIPKSSVGNNPIDLVQKTWIKFASTNNIKERSCFSLVPYKDSYYLIGGCDDLTYFDEFAEYSTTTSQWTTLENKAILKRSHHTCNLFQHSLYVLGGCRKLGYLKDFHTYDFESKKWSALESIPGVPRRGHATLVHQDSLYCFGGFDGNLYLNDLCRYDFEKKKWEVIKTQGDIPGREGHSFVAYKDQFYVFGGLTTSKQTNDLYSLDLNIMTWNKLIPSGHSIKPRAFHTGVIKESRIYIMGGHNSEEGWLDDFYEYSIDTNLFTCIDSLGACPSKRGGHVMFEKDGNFVLAGGYCSPKYYMDLYVCK